MAVRRKRCGRLLRSKVRRVISYNITSTSGRVQRNRIAGVDRYINSYFSEYNQAEEEKTGQVVTCERREEGLYLYSKVAQSKNPAIYHRGRRV